MAPRAGHHSCRDLILRRRGGGSAPDGRREVNRGQNVAEIRQIDSELKEKEGNDLELEELNLLKLNQGFKKDKCGLLVGEECG